jgi:microcystin-dependent protein
MAKTKISEFDVDPSNNTDINSINIAEGCAPSGINNAIRQLMSDLKEQQTGASGDNFTVGGNLAVTGTSSFTGAVTLTGGIAGGGFIPTGGIIIWSGAANAIPTGWLLCNGSSGTPDLRNRFVVGAGSTYAVGATGGSADAIVVSHTHTATVTDPGHSHTVTASTNISYDKPGSNKGASEFNQTSSSIIVESATTGISVSNASTGSSGTNANLPPYYALCYIMKA